MEQNKTWEQVRDLEINLEIAKAALRLVAVDKRPDGTYNRCREACAIVAKDALKKLGDPYGE
jgi:hypothetical protein